MIPVLARSDAGGVLWSTAAGTVVLNDATAAEAFVAVLMVRWNRTRPYLAVSHGFDQPLHFRLLARLKGSLEFFEVDGALDRVSPGDALVVKCWESGSTVEEVILYDFTPSAER